mmetsp:Transcript_11743/g.19114  ORF Transcript_11743/g.19114 Transcript_11743/m.19114 type:complete len:458 (-) Transcript_11743:69-1442(-)
MAAIPISTISLPRTLGRWNALQRVRSGCRWSASCLNKRWRYLENEDIDVLISRRCISGHVSTNHNGWGSGGAISTPREGGYSKRVLWSNWTEDTVRDPKASPILFEYDHLVRNTNNPSTEERLLKVLYQYGLVLITGTPTYTDSLPSDAMSEATKGTLAADTSSNANKESAESAIRRLASMVGYNPLQTLWGGGVWSTSSSSSFYKNDADGEGNEGTVGASTNDSAYGSASLPLHTDMAYVSNPPGVQVFLMVQPAEATASSSTSGESSLSNTTPKDDNKSITPMGQSVYLDGFCAAQQLLLENPEAFRLLATTARRYDCIDDEEGWHLEATGPIIETTGPRGGNKWGPVKSIRHNDLHRLPDLPPYPILGSAVNDSDSFYGKLRRAHDAWDDILGRDSMRLVIELQPGDCVLVANQRCFHGRYAFEASKFPRVVMGCYVGMDELSSKWRKIGLRVL